jgi:hypothetical protein
VVVPDEGRADQGDLLRDEAADEEPEDVGLAKAQAVINRSRHAPSARVDHRVRLARRDPHVRSS